MERYILWKSIPASIWGNLVKLLAAIPPLGVGVMGVVGILSTLPTSDNPDFAIVAAGLCAAIFCGTGALILYFSFSNKSRVIDLVSLNKKGLVCEESEGRNYSLYVGIVLIVISMLIVIMGYMIGIPAAFVSIFFWVPSVFCIYSYYSLNRNLQEIAASEILFSTGTPTLGRASTGHFMMNGTSIGTLSMELKCEKCSWESTKEGSEKKTTELIHKQSISISVEKDAGGNSSKANLIQFSIDIPGSKPESQGSAEGAIIWTVRAKGKAAIIKGNEGKIKEEKFSRTWIIPVITGSMNTEILSNKLEGELI